MKKKDLLFFLPVLSVSLLLQGTAAFFVYRYIHWESIPVDKPYQVFLLAVIGMVLTLVYIPEKVLLRISVFAVKLFCSMFAAQALGTAGSVYCFMTLSMMAELPLILPDIWGLAGVPLVLAVMLFSLRAHLSDYKYVAGISSAEKVLLVMFSIAASGIVGLLKYYYQSCSALKHEADRMTAVIDRVTDTNLAYQKYAAVVERSAIEKERQRVSREIHDIIGYTMTNVLMLIQAAQSCNDEKQAGLLLDKAQKHLSESVDDARLSLRRMREQEIPAERGRVLFSRLTKNFSDITGIRVSVDYGNLPPVLNSGVEKILFRMLEESMTNTFKHSSADLMTVNFLYDKGNIILRIFDKDSSSIPGAEIKEGIGLRGMRERIEPLGGTFTARFIAGGFLLRAVLPEGNPDE